jgi:hypothetical protein
VNTLYRERKVKIAVYADHAPPHFHVHTPEGDALIDLRTMKVIAGTIDPKSLTLAISWAMQNRKLLETEWFRLNQTDHHA